MKELLRQYRRTHRIVEAARDRIQGIPENRRSPEENYDLCHINTMLQDIGFIIRYIEQRKYPDRIHKVTKWATEQREILMEPDMMSRIFGCSCDFLHRRDDHDPEDNEIIKEYLAVLSPREKEVFLLIKDKAFSYRDVADMLGIHHGRVNNIMSRVGKKFEKLTNMKKPQGE